jgi:hypothetical protein
MAGAQYSGRFMLNKSATLVTQLLIAMATLSGCAIDPNGAGGLLNANASKPYIYSDAEKRGMSSDGFSNRIILPSEIKNYMTNKESPPTGEASYCDAGLAQLIQSRRNETLAAIAEACGGPDKYNIRRDGPGSVRARYFGNIQLTPSCTRGHVIVFKCTGAEPKPDMGK